MSADTDFTPLSGFIRHINRMDFIEFRSISSLCFNCVLIVFSLGLVNTGSY